MKAGVILVDLQAKHADTQFDLFATSQDAEQKEKNDKLMQTLDTINNKLCKHTVQLGGVRKQAPWQIKRELLSLVIPRVGMSCFRLNSHLLYGCCVLILLILMR